MILVFADRSDDDLYQQALTFARTLGDGDVQAVGIDDPNGYSPDGWATALANATAERGPSVVVAPGTERGNEVLAHVAAILDLPFAANCTKATPGDPLTLTRVRWGGSLLEEARLHGSPALLTVAPHAVAADDRSRTTSSSSRRLPRRRSPRIRTRRDRHRRRVARRRGRGRVRRARRRVGGGLRRDRGAGRAARRRGRLLARGDERRLAAAHRSGRPDWDEDLALAVHRVRDQRRHPAHGRLQGGQEADGDQPRQRGVDLRERRLRRVRRPARGRARRSRPRSAEQGAADSFADLRAGAGRRPRRERHAVHHPRPPAHRARTKSGADRTNGRRSAPSAQRGRDRARAAQAAPAARSGAVARVHLLGLHDPPPDDPDRADRHRRQARHAAVARPSGLVRAARRHLLRARARGRDRGAVDPQGAEAKALRGQPSRRGRPDPGADRDDRDQPAALARDADRAPPERMARELVPGLQRPVAPVRRQPDHEGARAGVRVDPRADDPRLPRLPPPLQAPAHLRRGGQRVVRAHSRRGPARAAQVRRPRRSRRRTPLRRGRVKRPDVEAGARHVLVHRVRPLPGRVSGVRHRQDPQPEARDHGAARRRVRGGHRRAAGPGRGSRGKHLGLRDVRGVHRRRARSRSSTSITSSTCAGTW